MNVLIVDDDRFVVAAIEQRINWRSLGFENVYLAYDYEGAKNVMSHNSIDLLLSDIDMPHGSGLDLLTWARSHYADIPCIFLTNYADFDYARQAISLHCFHYFLKPIDYEELTKIIVKAIQTFNMQDTNQHEKYVSYWRNVLLSGSIEGNDCPYQENCLLIPFRIQLYPNFLKSDNSLGTYVNDNPFETIKNILHDKIPASNNAGSILIQEKRSHDSFFGIIEVQSDLENMSELTASFEKVLNLLSSKLRCPLNIYLGTSAVIGNISEVLAKLRDMIRNCLGSTNTVFLMSAYKEPASDYAVPNTDLIYSSIETEAFDSLMDYCYKYLMGLKETGTLSYKALGSFQVDIIQALYAYLRKKGILAKRLYFGEPYRTISGNACRSIDDMQLYLRYIFFIAKENLALSSSEQSVADTIKEYVDQHYAEDIGRQSLESILYYEPDYASRLFKKETGYSFMNYVIKVRITEAKKLLKNTEMPISQISAAVGYDNYSYFTRLFKKETGQTPIEYRMAP